MKTKQSISGTFFINITIVFLSSLFILLFMWLKAMISDERNDSFLTYFSAIQSLEWVLIFFFAIVTTLIISNLLARDLTQDFKLFNAYFHDASKNLRKIDTGELKFQEFQDLAVSVNEMVDKVKHSQDEIKKQQLFFQTVLEAQKNIVFVFADETIHATNKAFLEFFDVSSIDDFYNRYHQLCILFVPSEESYSGCEKEGEHWYTYMMHRPEEIHKVKLDKSGTLHTFIVDARKIDISQRTYIVVGFSDITDIESERKMYEMAASTDALTGIANRLKFNTIVEQQIAFSKRYESSFSVVLFDIDDFKKVNDTYGHKVGDDVLIMLTDTVSKNIRESDTFARWGGEEFVLILPETKEKEAKEVAENIRKKIATLVCGEGFHITCSFGVREYNMQENSDIFMQEADWLLYKAKHGGKNRVCIR